MEVEPVLPSYDQGCVSNLVPALLGASASPAPWLPRIALEAEQVVLLVLDGLGADQLAQRASCAPAMLAMQGEPITTVAPSTTATALTSLTTGLAPGDHGVVGYRIVVGGEVLNVLRWTTGHGDARRSVPAAALQPVAAFAGQCPAVVTRAEFVHSGFTAAHLGGVRFTGYRTPGTLVAEVNRLVRGGEPFVYAYYEGIDKVSHEYGLGEHFDEELRLADSLVARLLETLPVGTALVVTADHGQVEVGDRVVQLPGDVLAHVALQSGEGRFRWLHARPGRAQALLDAARERLGGLAWVRSRDEVADQRWFGPRLSDEAVARLGDVALVAREDVAFADPTDTGPYDLVGRHGSLTAAEMRVPLLVDLAH